MTPSRRRPDAALRRDPFRPQRALRARHRRQLGHRRRQSRARSPRRAPRWCCVARREAELEVAAGRIAADGGKAAAIACDLADRAAVFALRRAGKRLLRRARYPGQRRRVNLRRPMLEITEEDWDATLSLNLAAPFFLSQRLAPAMIAKGWGRIINIASLQSVRAFAQQRAVRRLERAASCSSRARRPRRGRSTASPATRSRPDSSRPRSPRRSFERPGALEADGRNAPFIGRNGELPDLRGRRGVPGQPRLRLTSPGRPCSSTAGSPPGEGSRMKALVYTAPDE